jgi:hypothetical protein
MKYQLVVNEILKYTEKAGLSEEVEALRGAMDLLKVLPKTANDMISVGRLQNFDDVISHGNLLMQGTLYCMECTDINIKAKTMLSPKEMQVFLFQQVMIFADIVGRRTQFCEPSYIYKSHLLVSDSGVIISTQIIEKFPLLLRSTT